MNIAAIPKAKNIFFRDNGKIGFRIKSLGQVLWHLSMLAQDSQRVDTVARQETVKHIHTVK
jgi:hypothetical protein